MLVCLECGQVFDEDSVDIWEEGRGEYWGTSCSEKISGCPCCKGPYTEAHRCTYCGDWINGDYIKINGDRYCENCYDKYELGDE